MRTFFPYVLLFSVWFALPDFSLAQRVHTYVDVDSVQVGDVFNYIIVINGDYDTVSYPVEEDFEDDLEVISRERHQISSQRDSLVYQLQFFGTEDITIERQEILAQISGADTTLTTNPVPLYFKSALSEGDEEFRPFKPIFDFARSYGFFILILLILIIAGYLFYRWYSKRDFKSTPEPVAQPKPFIDPIDQLKKQLSNLKPTSQLNSEDDFDTYYVALGDAIRLYLKRVYLIQALEMTTREIILSLQKKMAPAEIISITKKVLAEADMVKFANFNPDVEQAELTLKSARQFVDVVSSIDRERIEVLKHQYEKEHGLLPDQETAQSGGQSV